MQSPKIIDLQIAAITFGAARNKYCVVINFTLWFVLFAFNFRTDKKIYWTRKTDRGERLSQQEDTENGRKEKKQKQR